MSDEWYWCLTHGRPERANERDDPDSALGPYDTELAARDWKQLRAQREAEWREGDDEESQPEV